jgi:hypothetical protein
MLECVLRCWSEVEILDCVLSFRSKDAPRREVFYATLCAAGAT